MTPKRPRAPDLRRDGEGDRRARDPALVVIALLTAGVGAGLPPRRLTMPPPSKVFRDTKELIIDPFFDHGGIDKGLFWHLSASLQRVAYGYSLARDRRYRARHAGRPVGLGDARARSAVPGAAHDSAARLAAAVARRLPGRPALGDLRHLHHLGLADHHQHRGRHPQHPAGLPQRRRGRAAQSAGILLQDHDPGGGALHLHRPAHRHRPVVARPSSRPKC